MEIILGLMLWVFLIAAYFMPAGIAVLKKKTNALSIFLTNLFLGWTFIGWVAALIWATTEDNK